MLRRSGPVAVARNTFSRGPEVVLFRAALALKLGPSSHLNFAAVKLAFILNTSLLSLFTCSLSSIAPGEIVKFPESVSRKDEVPNRKGQNIDEHPHHVSPRMSRDYDKNRRQTEN
ncbi:hypothetical protein RRF57_000387 [Xylaria bambusicola]|uniref:Uncharacterized protein n=1 Tax=Xylaria bambusicola TaxID=326684 RepID=A0AAN7UCS4_9PEZI